MCCILFFACKQKALEKGFRWHQQRLGYGVGNVEFILTDKYDTGYQWLKSGDNGCGDDSIIRFQNVKTKFYEIPKNWFDTLPPNEWKIFGYNCFDIKVNRCCNTKQGRQEDDSWMIKRTFRIEKGIKSYNRNFLGFDYDTLIKRDSFYISIRYTNFFELRNGKKIKEFTANTIYKHKEITFLFQNTEDADSTWFRSCLKTFESIKFVK